MSIVQSAHYQFLREAIEGIPHVSSHDHLRTEKVAVSSRTDLFDVLFDGVVWVDVVSAGFGREGAVPGFGPAWAQKPRDYEAMWNFVRPWLDHVREAAAYRSRLRGLQKLFELDEDLGDGNWRALNERVMEAQRPGWYREVLRERENLEASLNDVPHTWAQNDEADRFYSRNIMKMALWTDLHQQFRRQAGAGGTPIETLDQAVEALEAYVERIIGEGDVALKMHQAYYRTIEFQEVPRETAARDFPRLEDEGPVPRTVQDFMAGEICRLGAQYDVPVPVHTGYQLGNSNDIRNSNPQLLVPLVRRFPKTQFDIFHMSYPYCEEGLMLAKYFPNVTFNLTFGDQLSPSKIVEVLHIGLELLPSNKILAYGPDCFTVEGHYGSTAVTRDAIARCLAERVEAELLTRERAIRLMRKLVRDNAVEAYRLERWNGQHLSAPGAA